MNPRSPFSAKVAEMAQHPPDPAALKPFNEALRRAFLETGTETPDNLSCVDHLEYGAIPDKDWGVKAVYGLKLKRGRVMLSDIMNVVENCDMPPQVKAQFPKMSGEDWDAATRMITMILVALEQTEQAS